MAIVLDESKAADCRVVLEAETEVVISAGTLTEALIVAAGRNVGEEIAELVESLGMIVARVTASVAKRVASAYRLWGKGFHRAGLNFGDCFAYELAASRGCPLLYVGEDVARTDVMSAI